LDPDSLRLEPFSYSSHLSRSDGEFESYTRNFRLYPSDSGTAYAFGYFDSSGLSLFADGRRIPTPAFRYESRGMGQCGYYATISQVDIETKTDTGFALEVRKGDSAVRSWKVEYKFDGANAPAFRSIPTAEGLALSIVLKPGAEVGFLSFGYGRGVFNPPFQRMGDTLRADILFQDVDFMRAPTDSATMNRTTYAVCANFGSGYESVTIDGEPFPATADFCWEATGESRARIIEYVKPHCRNCK
jgi:hypothetical protein